MTHTSSPPAIAARGLRKSFGDQIVLDGIDLSVPAGTVFALLGPNGAGKTTTVHILSTLISADGGEIIVRRRSVRPWSGYRAARPVATSPRPDDSRCCRSGGRWRGEPVGPAAA